MPPSQRILHSLLRRYKNKPLYLLIGLALLFFAYKQGLLPEQNTSTEKSKTGTYLVTYVADGDTLHAHPLGSNGIKGVQNPKEKIKVRLYGIDAPEKKQAYGDKATQFLTHAVKDKEVHLVIKDTDHYGRSVAQIYLGDQYINKKLIEEGLAWHYKAYAQNEFDLQQAEQNARKARKNLWSQPSPQAPWDFRKQQFSKTR